MKHVMGDIFQGLEYSQTKPGMLWFILQISSIVCTLKQKWMITWGHLISTYITSIYEVCPDSEGSDVAVSHSIQLKREFFHRALAIKEWPPSHWSIQRWHLFVQAYPYLSKQHLVNELSQRALRKSRRCHVIMPLENWKSCHVIRPLSWIMAHIYIYITARWYRMVLGPIKHGTQNGLNLVGVDYRTCCRRFSRCQSANTVMRCNECVLYTCIYIYIHRYIHTHTHAIHIHVVYFQDILITQKPWT